MGSNNLCGHSGDVVPTLGLSWANLVTTRLMVSRTHAYVTAEPGQATTPAQKHSNKMVLKYNIRELEVVFCPWLDRKSCRFVVTNKGIEDVE